MKVALRPIDDEAAIAQLAERVYRDPEARRFTGSPDEDGVGPLTGMWVERAQNGWRVFDVLCDGGSVGIAGVAPVDAGSSAIGLYLDARGRGVGGPATERLLIEARSRGAGRARIVTHADNEPARRVVERLGFTLVGPYRADWAIESGEPWLEYSLALAPDAPSRSR